MSDNHDCYLGFSPADCSGCKEEKNEAYRQAVMKRQEYDKRMKQAETRIRRRGYL